MAEGVLVLGVGTGCKELSQFLHCTKEYVVTAKFGHATNTYDAEGHITHSGPIDHLTEEAVYKALSQFRGRITQLPPIYSALRIEGKRLYEYAREGKALPKPIQPRPVTIHQLDLVKYNADHCILRVECSSGTYMRSLVHDLGQALGTYAHMTALLRTRQGSMTLQDALTIEPYVDYEAVFKRLSSYQ
ncbi:tRNA pseudouridine synthase B [Radiomyces spectabilis]|uniref:tRNA pseudouridine synthase B n=1 Tax=Radiomyces spectabilis TaxID=64574 RepID=UPI00221E6138|nr:tRNA pseudouridine synthase B [Radiomyces spectabilis]KAI8384727.1 tRNA pseudouridine synthase B [Radiomyces spectabilis]